MVSTVTAGYSRHNPSNDVFPEVRPMDHAVDQEADAHGPVPEPGLADVLTAVVRADCSVEGGSPAAAGHLRAHRTLLVYARAFTNCPAPSAQFYWQDPAAGWLRVCLAGPAAQRH